MNTRKLFTLLLSTAWLMAVGLVWPATGIAATWNDLDSDRQPLSFALYDGAVLFENPWNSTATEAGAFSQPDQVLAGAFSLTSTATVGRATWYGTMYYNTMGSSDPLDNGDIWPFSITFLYFTASMPGDPFYNTLVDATVTDTGIDIQLLPWIEPERVYLFDASFSGPLLGGEWYFFSVVNVSTPYTFRWNTGTNTQYSGFFSTDYSEVPEPSTMLLLGSGLIGLAGYGRKKFFKK